MSESVPPSSARLATRVSLLAVAVGAAVATAAGFYGAGGCSGSGSGAFGAAGGMDPVCYRLVRTLAERVGLVTAVATAVIVLTFVGLARTTTVRVARDGPRGKHLG